MKISFGTWALSFGPYADSPVPLEDAVRRLAEVGYDGVELCGFPPHVSLEAYPDSGSRRTLARMLDDLNLGVSGYLADLSSINPTIDGNQTRYLELFKKNVEICRDISSPLIRVDTGAAPGGIDEDEYESTMDRIADIWCSAAEIANQAGVKVSWECEPGFAFNKISEVLAIHEKVDHPNFGIMLDTCHAYMCSIVGARQHGLKETLKGGIPELLEKLKGRINHVHLVDSDGSLYGEETSTHKPVGEGKIDFSDLTPRLLAIKGVSWWCVDMSFCAGCFELLEPSLAYVRNLLKNSSLR